MDSTAKALAKKLSLIKFYHEKIAKMEHERSGITKKINRARERYTALIQVEADPAQLLLFENLDEFLSSNPDMIEE